MKKAILWGVLAVGALSLSPVWAKPISPAESASQEDHDHAASGRNADETPVDYFWRKSDEAFHDGDFERAIGLHKAIVALAPDDVESYGVGAWLMWSLGRGDDARAFIARGLKANPNSSDMWDTAAQQYDLQKDYGAARDAYVKAVSLAGDRADQLLRRRLAHAAEHANDFDLSVKTWQALVQDYPSEAVNKNNLARVEAAMNAPADKAPVVSTTTWLGAGAGATLLALVPFAVRRLS